MVAVFSWICRELNLVVQPHYHLAVSLHAPDDTLRNQLVPVNKKTGLRQILAASDRYFEDSGRRLTFEYVLLAEVNDQPEHARRLAGLLRGRPALLRRADPHELAKEVIDRLGSGDRGEEAYEAVLHRMACRAAVKAGDRLSNEELKSLLEDADRIDFSGRCPHGRPTTVMFTLDELEELFKRRGF